MDGPYRDPAPGGCSGALLAWFCLVASVAGLVWVIDAIASIL